MEDGKLRRFDEPADSVAALKRFFKDDLGIDRKV